MPVLNRLRRRFYQVDRGLWLAVLLSLLAAWAFILRPSLPRETDAELHVFRAAELGYALRAGVLYPRWAADFYYGYGYPIFNYYAPLTYYLANLLSLALPGGAVFGVKAVFVLGFLSAGVGTYGLTRRLIDRRGALIATASYLFAPYIFLIDPHLRGVLAEFFALGLLPPVFWALTAFRQSPSRKHLVVASLLVTAFLLSHNLMALVGFGMLLAYTLWHALIVPLLIGSRPRPTDAIRQAFPLLIGLALAAFFWLPVIMERDAVQLGNLIGPGHFDYHNHFLSLRELFSPSVPLDLGAVNPAFRFNLGLAQWALALIGLVALALVTVHARRTGTRWAAQAEQTAGAAFWLLALIGLIGLMLPLSTPIWEAIPPMAFLQFPWRLLGTAALCAAVLAGYTAHLLDLAPRPAQPYTFAALFVLPLVLALPIFIPPTWNWHDFGPTDQLAMLEFELNGLALGTTSTGDYVPVEVEVVPDPNPDLIASYRRGGPIDKVNRHTLPEGASVEIIRHRPTADVFAVHSPEGFILRLYTFMFEGWRASVDGQPVTIEVAKPEGFITVPVPPGDHVVRVWLGTTPARTLGTLISLAGLGALALATYRLPSAIVEEENEQQAGVDGRPILLALAVFVSVAAAGGRLSLFQPRSSGLIALPAQERLHAYLEGGVDLIGYDLPITSAEPGESLPLTLYWKAREPVPGNYQVFVHLTSIPQHTWGQSDKLNPGDYPTTRWPLDRYVRDPHTLTIPPGTPPGEYTLRVGLWNRATGVRQLVLAPDGEILGDSIALPTSVTVLPASRQPAPEELPLDVVLNEQAAPELTLLGAEIDPGPVFESEMGLLRVILYWRASERPSVEYEVALRLVDASGAEALRADGPPVDGRYPTDRWETGQVVRDVHSFWIDSDLPAGMYRLEAGLIAPDDAGPIAWLRLGDVERRLNSE